MKHNLILIITLVFLVGCEDDNIKRTDDENRILELAYDNDYLYPEGFYHELISIGSAYYVNTISITPVSEREHIWIELSTDDRDEALLWSNKSNENSTVNREIISEKETEKYFEFTRQNIVYGNDVLLSRIHKSSYFRPTLDRFLEPDTIGIYMGELTKNKVKVLIEF